LYGFLDQAWRPHMSKDEAERFVVKSIALAIARDGASGGVVRTVTVNEHGVERNFFAGDKLPLFHEEIPPSRNSLLA
jgi:20S proteasome subunit beta 1